MKTLFDKTSINGVELKNRFIRSATTEHLADERGGVSVKMFELYESLAKGGVGLIVTSLIYLTENAKATNGQIGLYSDELIEEYKELTSAVHKYGSKIFAQLAIVALNGEFLSPMNVNADDIKTIVNSFGDAASRAKKAGFDGIQIHAAHGFLFSQFISPYFNRRSDGYNGSIDNRAKIIYDAYESARSGVGQSYPIIIKINCEDFIDEGLSFDESKKVCLKLAKLGVDAIEVSGGTIITSPHMGTSRKIEKSGESYFKNYAKELSCEIDVPLILVGGNRDIDSMTNILDQTSIEYFSMSRPLLCESNLINRWESGDHGAAKCLSCNKCLESTENASNCVQNKGV